LAAASSTQPSRTSQSNEVPGDHHHRQLPHAVVDVRPGDQDAATTVKAWLQDYATSRDPKLRERIILAYLGVADRLASGSATAAGPAPRTWSRPLGPG
jgi:hypothetical protein